MCIYKYLHFTSIRVAGHVGKRRRIIEDCIFGLLLGKLLITVPLRISHVQDHTNTCIVLRGALVGKYARMRGEGSSSGSRA